MRPLSRQRRWQLARLAAGLCAQCGRAPCFRSTHACYKCLVRRRRATRARKGSVPWRPDGLGRPPAEALDDPRERD